MWVRRSRAPTRPSPAPAVSLDAGARCALSGLDAAHGRPGALPAGPRGGLVHTLRYLRSPFVLQRTAGDAWRCEPLHAHGELFADLGAHDVALTIPDRLTVVATGS